VILGFLVIVGIYIIFHFDPRFKTGIILGVSSAIFLAIVMIVLRQFVQRINSPTILTYQLTGGLLTLTLCMPFYLYRFPADSLIPGWEDWLWLLVLAWLCSVLAFQFTMEALKKLSAFTVNLNFNLEPVYGILLAFAIYKENRLLSEWFYVGFFIIAAALALHVAMLILEQKRRSPYAAE
jgi:drug/metabolite transporter (DMT)-like permease